MNIELLKKIYKSEPNGYTGGDTVQEINDLKELRDRGMILRHFNGKHFICPQGHVQLFADHDLDTICNQIPYFDGDELETLFESIIKTFENKELTNFNRDAIIHGLNCVKSIIRNRTSN